MSAAVEKMAELLQMNVEVVTSKRQSAPIYVYYKNGDEEPIPIYCDKDNGSDMPDICTALRNMMFVLSFHPKHLALRQMRKEIMQFS